MPINTSRREDIRLSEALGPEGPSPPERSEHNPPPTGGHNLRLGGPSTFPFTTLLHNLRHPPRPFVPKGRKKTSEPGREAAFDKGAIMIEDILKKYPFIVLDGAFSTELERQGFSINDDLWSAIALYERPDLVKAVHRSYFDAGSDIVTSASYQATLEGFEKKGFSRKEGRELLIRSVQLVQEARDEFLAESSPERRPVPLAAASVGPYGAFLADGSEYKGHYGKTREELADFHRERLHILAEAGPDIFACETIPCLLEALAETDVLSEIKNASAWVCFSCKDGLHTCGDDYIGDCAKALDPIPCVKAIGVNCTAPEYVESLILEIRKYTSKPVVVYPNSGEHYDPSGKTWGGAAADYADFVKIWQKAGARLIGGCCRTTPEDIKKVAAFRQELMGQQRD